MSILTALSQPLRSFPRELLPIVESYAKDRPHAWQDQHTVDSERTTNAAWFRFASTETVIAGPHRWQITGQTMLRNSPLAVGITSAPVGSVRDCGTNDRQIASIDDLLISAWPNLQAAALHNGTVKILPFHIGTMAIGRYEYESVFGIEIDIDARTMAVRFCDRKRRWRQIVFGVPGGMDINNCRPCVVIGGSASAAISPLSDDDVPRFIQKSKTVRF